MQTEIDWLNLRLERPFPCHFLTKHICVPKTSPHFQKVICLDFSDIFFWPRMAALNHSHHVMYGRAFYIWSRCCDADHGKYLEKRVGLGIQMESDKLWLKWNVTDGLRKVVILLIWAFMALHYGCLTHLLTYLLVSNVRTTWWPNHSQLCEKLKKITQCPNCLSLHTDTKQLVRKREKGGEQMNKKNPHNHLSCQTNYFL